MSLFDLIPSAGSERHSDTAFGPALASEQVSKVAKYVEAKSVDFKRIVSQSARDRPIRTILASVCIGFAVGALWRF
jgi:hypothetical protein